MPKRVLRGLGNPMMKGLAKMSDQFEEPFVLDTTMSRPSLAATTGISAGILLLGTAAAGFHDLAPRTDATVGGPPARSGRIGTVGG